MPNALQHETSPYLLDHAHNPVDWHPWGADALALAAREKKPILLSVGYGACHWCHVMARESFSDPRTAELMNRFFVNIKVDREERPDIDALYQQALQATGRSGGWPLTMFLTPRGEPFWGGTYFPVEAQHGLPGFRQVLWQVAQAWRTEAAQTKANVETLMETLKANTTPTFGRYDLAPQKLVEYAEHLLPLVDATHGGFGQAPKFPCVPALELLWRGARRGGPRLMEAAVRHTLDRICLGGIYDHLGGGFARYTVDVAWRVPHFEKMLCDNAQLIHLLTEVWRHTKSPLYADRVASTISWLEHTMRIGRTGFAASTDADSGGEEGAEEGAFYLWTPDDITAALGREAADFMQAYGVDEVGVLGGKSVLHQSHLEAYDPTAHARLRPALEKLSSVRDIRKAPRRDTKILTDWNGMAIAAIADAGWAFDRSDWVKLAEDAFGWMCRYLTDGDRLWHTWQQGRGRGTGLLDDYACMAQAALTLYEVTGTDTYLGHAQRWVHTAVNIFADPKGGFYQTPADSRDLPLRLKPFFDTATPSGNGVMIGVLGRLYALTGNAAWSELARLAFAATGGDLKNQVMPYAGLLSGMASLTQPVQMVLDGEEGLTRHALHKAVGAFSCPDRMLLHTGAQMSAAHPVYEQLGTRAAVHVCLNHHCLHPVYDPAELATAVEPALKVEG